MSVKGNKFHFTRGKSARRSMLIACGAVCNVAMLSFMASSAHAQSSFTWTSSSGGNWSNGANWAGGSGPTTGVDSTGDVSLEYNAAGSYTSNNDLGSYGVFNMTFDATNGTTNLTGGQLNLSNPSSEPVNPTFTNNSLNPVTINNNAVIVSSDAQGDGTLEQFVLAPGSTTTFNGTMTLMGGGGLTMTNGQAAASTGGPGGTLIWTQPVTFTNSPAGLGGGGYFPFRIYEGTLEMGGYTIYNGTSNAPVLNEGGVNVLQNSSTSGATNNGAMTDVYIGPEDFEDGHPNDVASFYLIAGGNSFNQPVQVGDAGTITIGGVNTSGTVTFNDFFKTLPTDGNGIVNGVSQTIYYSAAAGGTVLQNFQLIRGGGSGVCGAGIDKIGAGTWIVAGGGTNDTGEQAYQGNTTVRDGTLELAYDDTGINMVTLPASALSAGAPYYSSGLDGGSLGFNAPTNAVQLGDSGTLATDNIAFLTLNNSGAPGPRQVLHNISVNHDNPSGTTTIGVGDNGTGNFTGNILLNENVQLTGGTGGVANFSGNITGVGGVTASGTGIVNLSGTNGYVGATSVSSGATLVSTVTGALPTGTHVTNNGALVVNGNATLGSLTGTGTLTIAPASGSNSVKLAANSGLATEGGLTIAANSTLDIANNHMVISYTGSPTTPDATIRGLLISGRNGGTWNGTTGIISSGSSGTGVAAGYSVGYADGADHVVTGLSSGQIEVKYTLLGDANLDGLVTGDDFTILVGNLGKSISGWDKGDFLYTGLVTGDDFTALVGNLGKSATGADVAIPAADLAAIDAFAVANNLTLPSVPEPASVGLLVVAGVGVLARRRRSIA